MTATRVLLVDDHNLVRAGLRALLQALPDVVVVGEAVDAAGALALAEETQPDLVLMDIALKAGNGLDATERLRARWPGLRVVVLSMHVTGDYVERALRAGACGYMLKDAATLELELALAAAMRGEIYLSPAVSAQVVAGYLDGGKPAENPLTPRQTEILRRLAAGESVKEIAFDLGLSVKTVETHRAQIMERLEIRDLAGLVRYAIRVGLVRADA